jgi:hypothetical protein
MVHVVVKQAILEQCVTLVQTGTRKLKMGVVKKVKAHHNLLVPKSMPHNNNPLLGIFLMQQKTCKKIMFILKFISL